MLKSNRGQYLTVVQPHWISISLSSALTRTVWLILNHDYQYLIFEYQDVFYQDFNTTLWNNDVRREEFPIVSYCTTKFSFLCRSSWIAVHKRCYFILGVHKRSSSKYYKRISQFFVQIIVQGNVEGKHPTQWKIR